MQNPFQMLAGIAFAVVLFPIVLVAWLVLSSTPVFREDSQSLRLDMIDIRALAVAEYNAQAEKSDQGTKTWPMRAYQRRVSLA